MKTKFNRRDFLKVASIGTASALALSCGVLIPDEEGEIMTAPLSTSADVLVLGAGIAGLAAARTLTDKGQSVIVLEGARVIPKKALENGFKFRYAELKGRPTRRQPRGSRDCRRKRGRSLLRAH